MKSISVFCGSSSGTDPVLMDTARQLGIHLASSGIGLIYGGARVGLMGAVADGALSAGGEVTGILPSFLREKEIAHQGLTRLISVDSMHGAKAADASDVGRCHRSSWRIRHTGGVF